MELKRIEKEFTVCKLKSIENINWKEEYFFLGNSDEELSLVCTKEAVPLDCLSCEEGWRAFRIQGILDFSMIGVISRISTLLAENQIGIFVISTFNTDYVLVKENLFERGLSILRDAGYVIT